ncbi:MAG TPA: metallophosphoesterase [Gemmatimonadales bacterium]|nr:metallophosphoesterase [Gemmatimonadales bacterium]
MRSPAWRFAALATLGIGVQACGPARPANAAPGTAPPAPPAEIDVSLFLIGDAGAPAAPPDSEPVLMALRVAASAAPHPVIVFLGDNVYPDGMPDSAAPKRRAAERVLTQQLRVLQASGAGGFFVPGNHDWDGMHPGGWDAIRRQERFIAAAGGGAVLLPAGGCPGPAVVDLGDVVRLVALDSQWWLQDGPKPGPTSSCPAATEGAVIDSLRAALRAAGKRVVVVAAHHPPASGGVHGGHFGWQDHIFPLRNIKSWLWIPLPVIGSVYPVARAEGISSQDIPSRAYTRMRVAFDSAFAGAPAPPLIYAAGHEHTLQVIAGTSTRYVLVSGTGTFGHIERVTALDSTRFARSASGFMRVEFLRDGRARLGVMIIDRAGSATEEFGLWLN